MMNKYSNPNKTVKAVIGENFIISLDSNPTTGYEWKTEFDSSFIKHDNEQDRRFYRTSLEEIGSGGEEEFEFQPLKSGKTKIVMKYKRAWEIEPLEKKVFNIEIKLGP